MQTAELIAAFIGIVLILRGLYLAALTDQRKRLVLRIVDSPRLGKISIASLPIGAVIFYYGTKGLSLAVKVNAFVGAVIMFNALFLAFPNSYREFVKGYFGQPKGMIRLQGLVIALIGVLVLYSIRQGY